MNIVWASFSKMDTDGDGRITTDEFMSVLLGGNTHLMDESEIQK